MEQNILIVDDSLINRELLQYILQDPAIRSTRRKTVPRLLR